MDVKQFREEALNNEAIYKKEQDVERTKKLAKIEEKLGMKVNEFLDIVLQYHLDEIKKVGNKFNLFELRRDIEDYIEIDNRIEPDFNIGIYDEMKDEITDYFEYKGYSVEYKSGYYPLFQVSYKEDIQIFELRCEKQTYEIGVKDVKTIECITHHQKDYYIVQYHNGSFTEVYNYDEVYYRKAIMI